MKPWLKIGLLAGVFQIALSAPGYLYFVWPSGLTSLLAVCSCLPYFFIAPLAGAVAALMLAPPRSVSTAAKTGALAGIVASLLDGLCTSAIGIVLAVSGSYQSFFRQGLPPESLRSLEQTGLMQMYTPLGQVVMGVVGTAAVVVWGAFAGGILGALAAALKRD